MAYPSHIETLLVGATFFAAGYAASAQEQCLILEQKSVVGSDFADCMNASPCRTEELSPRIEAFRSELLRRGLLNGEGHVHVVPCAAVLATFLRNESVPVLLETNTIAVERNQEAFTLRMFNRDGFQTLTADRVIDTTGFLTGRAFRSLGLMLVNGSSDLSGVREDRYWIQKGLFPDEFILHQVLSPEDTVLSARQKLFQLIESGEAALAGWQAAAGASTFAYHYPDGPLIQKAGNGVLRIPSASFGDLLAALENGGRYALSHTC